MSPARPSVGLLSRKKTTEILTRLVNEAVWLQGEPWASPKREQWTSSARAALERAFPSGSSIIQRFETAETLVFNRDTSDEEMRQMVLIFAGLGKETAAYAAQFSSLFRKANWVVEGPRPAPVNQPVLDLQISIDEQIYTHPEIQAIMSALRSARVKSRPGAVHNHNVPGDWIVLWVGARTPDDEPLHVPLDVPSGTFTQLR